MDIPQNVPFLKYTASDHRGTIYMTVTGPMKSISALPGPRVFTDSPGMGSLGEGTPGMSTLAVSTRGLNSWRPNSPGTGSTGTGQGQAGSC